MSVHLPSRKSRGKRFRRVLDEEQEADDEFWSQEFFKEDEKDDDVYETESEKESVADSDFSDSVFSHPFQKKLLHRKRKAMETPFLKNL